MKKKLLICAAAMVCASAATAQTPGIAPVGVVNGEVSQPVTSLYVTVTVEQQDIIAGPYARYAQKYLGVSAPLADKVLHEIKSATISDVSSLQPMAAEGGAVPVLHMAPERGFPKLLIDKTSNSQASLEESARLAANQIFKIRKNRYELITGEAGENVFGAGLESALEELDRLENEYLSLFLGKQVNTISVRQYRVTPEAGKQAYVFGRFSDADGLLPDDDLSGQPIALEVKALNAISTDGLNILSKPSKTASAYRIADDVLCRVIYGNAEIASAVIPVFQLGKTVYIAP